MDMKTTQDEWQARPPTNNFMTHQGPTHLRMRDGRPEFAFDTGELHMNSNGVVHGGMLMTFADYALGWTARMVNEDRPSVTITLKLDFVSSAQAGERITCQPEIVRRTRSLFFMRGDIMAGDRVVASATGIWKILER